MPARIFQIVVRLRGVAEPPAARPNANLRAFSATVGTRFSE
ncbi:hypothetical protein BV133_2460 [Blastochloris viridis]|uniref:Uncharacterized protein n=1 Tax=Blastochloris viridis TaxID=1079 RepID=A0A182D4F6_BLAVI|nr:hypothetical protein BV133_2460 [Blastochloris viridis]